MTGHPTVRFRLSPKRRTQLHAFAASRGITLSDLIREGITAIVGPEKIVGNRVDLSEDILERDTAWHRIPSEERAEILMDHYRSQA